MEFSDLPLTGVPRSDTYHGFFPAKYVAAYLESYIESRIYAGKSLLSRVNFNSKVDLLIKVDTGWELHVVKTDGEHTTKTTCYALKVIDATGLTSTPNIPSIPGREIFEGQVFHHKDFGKLQDSILKNSKPRDIVVIGGAKSAADVAYACAKAEHNVHWIIRRSGAGPAAIVAAKGSWPYSNSNESFYTRFTSHFLASWFFDESKTWLGRFLYKTNMGRRFLKAAWQAINHKAQRLADYDRADGQKNGFYNLRPDTEIFWQNDSTGICQRDDFFDTIATKVRVYREDIKSMTATSVELASGDIVDADLVIFATGWTTSHPRIKLGANAEDGGLCLGLTMAYTEHNSTSDDEWRKMESEAEQEALDRFAILSERPHYYRDTTLSNKAPLRLYKGVLPIKDRSIAFAGQLLCGNNFRIAEVHALYAVAALDGILALPDEEHMKVTIAHTIAWNRLRYLAKGRYGSWIYWDMVPYTDDLLAELGLHSHKHGSWWRNLFAPCFASDLRGLIDEYSAKHLTSTTAKPEKDRRR